MEDVPLAPALVGRRSSSTWPATLAAGASSTVMSAFSVLMGMASDCGSESTVSVMAMRLRPGPAPRRTMWATVPAPLTPGFSPVRVK